MRVLADRYELTERLGRGGMGEVYRAEDRTLRRTVAIKLLSTEFSQDREFLARFQREARTIARLNHPCIATLHDTGEDVTNGERTPFLVMEYVEGRTLDQVVNDGSLPVERAVSIVDDVLDALAHSHQSGVVHRDIKPSNVMITRTGRIKVLDFGIARALAETSTRLTATGVAVGTPAYLSPEQVEGARGDHRSDLYSVGCLFYELLVGRPPFSADSPLAVLHQHLYQDPTPPSRGRPGVPQPVDAVVMRALAKQPAERFPNAEAMRQALSGPAPQPAPLPAPPPPGGHPAFGPPPPMGPVEDRRPTDQDTPSMNVVLPRRPWQELAFPALGCLAAFQLGLDGTPYGGSMGYSTLVLIVSLLGLPAMLWLPRTCTAVVWGVTANGMVGWGFADYSDPLGWVLAHKKNEIPFTLTLLAAAACCLWASVTAKDSGAFPMLGYWGLLALVLHAEIGPDWLKDRFDPTYGEAPNDRTQLVFYLLIAATAGFVGIREWRTVRPAFSQPGRVSAQ